MKMIKVWALILLVAFMGCQDPLKSPDTTRDKLREAGYAGTYTASGAKVFPYTTANVNINKPTAFTQTELDKHVKAYYTYWKATNVEPSKTTYNGFYVRADITGEEPADWKKAGVTAKSQSEAHGYGMVIAALMGDKELFDGLYEVYKDYPAKNSPELMSWIIPESEMPDLSKSNSATDGDLDIAYALLLADNQWGSEGSIKYLGQAYLIIEAIKAHDFDATTKRAKLGDWDNSGENTRPSDWMVSHFRTFYNYTKDTFWLDAIDEVYTMINEVTTTYSPSTYLLPDFVTGDPAIPAAPNFLEKEQDGDYYYNACRYPWRIAMDYGQFGETRSKDALAGLVNWAVNKARTTKDADPNQPGPGEDPLNLTDYYYAGYTLAGEAIVNYSDRCFYAPLAVAVSHYPGYEDFLDDAWAYMKEPDLTWGSYFDETINMQCMLYISGNWWVPEGEFVPPSQPGKPVVSNIKEHSADFSWAAATDNEAISHYEIHTQNRRLGWSTTNSFSVSAGSRIAFADDTEFTITIVAVDNDGLKSAPSEPVTFRTLQGGIIPPTKPQNVIVTNKADTNALISWMSSSQPSADMSIRGHLISINNSEPVYVGYVKGGSNIGEFATSYLCLGLRPNTTYTASIQGLNNRGLKSEAVTVQFTTTAMKQTVKVDPAAVAEPEKVEIVWDGLHDKPASFPIQAKIPVGNNATLVRLYENNVLIDTIEPNFNTPNEQIIEFQITNKPSGVYNYQIEALNQHGASYSDDRSFMVDMPVQ